MRNTNLPELDKNTCQSLLSNLSTQNHVPLRRGCSVRNQDLYFVRVCKVIGKICAQLIVGAGPCARPMLEYQAWRGTGTRRTVDKR